MQGITGEKKNTILFHVYNDPVPEEATLSGCHWKNRLLTGILQSVLIQMSEYLICLRTMFHLLKVTIH